MTRSWRERTGSTVAKEVDMGCAHGPHDCGAWYGGPYSDWSEEMDWPVRRRARRVRRADPDPSTDEIVARLDELRDEVRRVGAELEKLRGARGAVAGKV